jgi:Ig-like domain from next to BRCA1 gene
VSKGPLAVRWGAAPALAPQAGVVHDVPVDVENTGTIAWSDRVLLAYHWLDDRDNAIVWDGLRTPVPHVAPGERATVAARLRAPMPPGRYRLAFDMVAEQRAWFSELGSGMLTLDLDVEPRGGEPLADLPPGLEPRPDWRERVRAAHAEGFGVVAGAIDFDGGRRPRALAAYAPGPGRVPGFSAPLVAPSVLPGIELERLDDVEGLPAYAAPRDEPWVYDGRIVLTARPRSGRRRG